MPILENGQRRVRLGYCTNVHPGEILDEVERSLARFAARVRERLEPRPSRMGVGLWLAAPLARALAQDLGAALRLRRRLEELRLFCFTLNAFPWGGFHAARVKREVYRPAWDAPERLAYTLDAARALAALLPDEEEMGTVSTLPIGWGEEFRGAEGEGRFLRALENIALLVKELRRLLERTGKRVRVLFEPEPGCRVETTEGLVDLFRRIAGRASFAEQAVMVRHLGANFDCCHQAVMGEDLAMALSALHRVQLPVGKLHLSSAVEGTVGALAPLAEPRYLHQVRALEGEGGAEEVEGEDAPAPCPRADDLSDVASDPGWSGRRVRCHFHVPIHRATLGASGLATTQAALAAAMDEALAWPAPPDLEVETYTWGVLPEEAGGGAAGAGPEDAADALVAGLAAEMQWALDQARRRGYTLEEPEAPERRCEIG
jgi:sugar phosphate isomerase/epimerase